MNIILRVSMSVSGNGLSSDITVKGNNVVTDKNGTVFTQSQLDKLVFTTSSGDLIKDGVLSAKIQLWKVEQNVKVNIGTYGDPAPGYCVSEVKVTPENISIAGDEETLAELNGELSLTDMISVEGVSESFTSDTINLADYLKENYKDKLKVKSGTATTDEIARLIEFSKANGGIEYATKVMIEFKEKALSLLASMEDTDVKKALVCYLDYVVEREK